MVNEAWVAVGKISQIIQEKNISVNNLEAYLIGGIKKYFKRTLMYGANRNEIAGVMTHSETKTSRDASPTSDCDQTRDVVSRNEKLEAIQFSARQTWYFDPYDTPLFAAAYYQSLKKVTRSTYVSWRVFERICEKRWFYYQFIIPLFLTYHQLPIHIVFHTQLVESKEIRDGDYPRSSVHLLKHKTLQPTLPLLCRETMDRFKNYRWERRPFAYDEKLLGPPGYHFYILPSDKEIEIPRNIHTFFSYFSIHTASIQVWSTYKTKYLICAGS